VGLGKGVGGMKGGGVVSGRGSESGVIVRGEITQIMQHARAGTEYGGWSMKGNKGKIRDHESRFEV